MEWFKELEIKPAPILLHPNKYKIPVQIIPANVAGAKRFNRYLETLYNSEYGIIERTESSGISIAKNHFRPPCYDVRKTSTCIEATVIDIDGMVRVQFRSGFGEETPEDMKITGNQSWRLFIGFCNQHGVNLYDLAISKEEGIKYKNQIQKPLIALDHPSFRDLIFERCHHLDMNASHPSGMAEAFPVLRPVIQDIYDHRKESPRNKALLTHVWGYMQSMGTQYRFAHISKAGMDYTCRRVHDLAENLANNGRQPILYNTDGIWYTGDVWHGPGEGYGLGMWKNDHVNCKFRARSAGCYEYEESNGVYHPVVRGKTTLDNIKPRDQWMWGDIYREEADPIMFLWDGNYVRDKEGNIYGKEV